MPCETKGTVNLQKRAEFLYKIRALRSQGQCERSDVCVLPCDDETDGGRIEEECAQSGLRPASKGCARANAVTPLAGSGSPELRSYARSRVLVHTRLLPDRPRCKPGIHFRKVTINGEERRADLACIKKMRAPRHNGRHNPSEVCCWR